MNEFSNYEYVVAQKNEGKWRVRRLGLVFLYIAFVIGWFVFGFISNLFPLMALIPVTLWILVFFTWRYVNVEYEYAVVSGIVTFSNIYGNKSRRTVKEFAIRDCSLIAPLSESADKIRAFAPECTINALSSAEAEDAYVALFADANSGKHIAVCFEATEKMLKICRFYNSSCTVVKSVKY